MSVKIVIILCLGWVFLETSVFGAPPVSRGPTERWFIPRQTVTSLQWNVRMITEIMRPSCVHFEPETEPCETSRAARLNPSAAVHNMNEVSSTTYKLGETPSPLLPSTSSMDEESVHYTSIASPALRHNWAFLGFNLDTTVTHIETITETKRVVDPSRTITVTIRGCTPIPFDIPECEEDIILPTQSSTMMIQVSATASVVHNNDNTEKTESDMSTDSEVAMTTTATEPLVMVREKISVTRIQEELTFIDSTNIQIKSQEMITTEKEQDTTEEEKILEKYNADGGETTTTKTTQEVNNINVSNRTDEMVVIVKTFSSLGGSMEEKTTHIKNETHVSDNQLLGETITNVTIQTQSTEIPTVDDESRKSENQYFSTVYPEVNAEIITTVRLQEEKILAEVEETVVTDSSTMTIVQNTDIVPETNRNPEVEDTSVFVNENIRKTPTYASPSHVAEQSEYQVDLATMSPKQVTIEEETTTAFNDNNKNQEIGTTGVTEETPVSPEIMKDIDTTIAVIRNLLSSRKDSSTELI